jgi:hypothetical protein
MLRIAPLLGCLLLTSCANVCDRMCDAEADLQERCFDTWGSSWTGEGYADRTDFLDRCYAVWGGALEDLSNDDPDRQILEDRCQRQLGEARADLECDALLSIEP